jgi:hypothetical protein
MERVEPYSRSTSMGWLSKPKVGLLSALQSDSEAQRWNRVTANRDRTPRKLNAKHGCLYTPTQLQLGPSVTKESNKPAGSDGRRDLI